MKHPCDELSDLDLEAVAAGKEGEHPSTTLDLKRGDIRYPGQLPVANGHVL